VKLRPLVTVLSEVGLVMPRLVLIRGGHYWRIEDLILWAKQDAASGPPDARQSLLAPVYWWEDDGRGKAVIWMQGTQGPRPVFSEVGSDVLVEAD
jgi:hypothetical protein